MGKSLTITAPINKANVIICLVILAAGLYKFLESPSLSYGAISVIMMLILLFLTFARDEVRLDPADDGVIESKLWTITGMKKYKYQGLTKASSISAVDIGAADAGELIKSYLLFADSYKLPIPGEDVVRENIVGWFQSNYNLNLSIMKK